MDADDIALPGLVKKQLNYFNQNKEAHICGVQIEMFGKHNGVTKHPLMITRPKAYINRSYWFVNNPGCCFTKSALIAAGGYMEMDGKFAEDYNMFCRLLNKGYKIYNHSEVLLKYRLELNYASDKSAEEKIVNNKQLEMDRQSLK